MQQNRRFSRHTCNQVIIDCEITPIEDSRMETVTYLLNGEKRLGGQQTQESMLSNMKNGMWSEIMYWDKRNEIVSFEGEYQEGYKVGSWQYVSTSKGVIGGGKFAKSDNPDLLGTHKVGSWEEIISQYYTKFQNQLYYIKVYENFKEGIYDGEWKWEDSTGKQFVQGKYVRNQKVGKWKEIDAYVSQSEITYIFTEGEYQNNLKVGYWNIFDETGTQLGGGNYKDGQRVGKWIVVQVQSSYKNEILQVHKEYHKGQLINRCSIRNMQGDEIGGGRYYQGWKKWSWVDPYVYNTLNNRIVIEHQVEYDTQKRNKKQTKFICNQASGQPIFVGFEYDQFQELRVYSTPQSYIYLLFTNEVIQQEKHVEVRILLPEAGAQLLEKWTESNNGTLNVTIDVDCQNSLIYINKGAQNRDGRQVIDCIYYEDCVNDIARQEIAGGEIVNGFKHGQFTEKVTGLNSREVLITSGEYQNGIKHGKWVQKIISMHHQTKEIGEGVYEQGVKKGNWVDVEPKVNSSNQDLQFKSAPDLIEKKYDFEINKDRSQKQQLEIQPQVKMMQQIHPLPKQPTKKSEKAAKLKEKQLKIKFEI